jgi:hypothetical protein
MTSIFPLVGIAEGEGIPSLLPPTGNVAQTPAVSSSNSTASAIQGALATIGRGAASTGNSFLNSLFGSNYQYLTGIIGLILIAAGIFLFRPVRDTIVKVSGTAAKAAAKGAEVAAVA